MSICTKCSKEASNYLHCPHCGAPHRALVLPPKVSSPRAPTTVLTPAQERAARAAKRAADWVRLTPTQKKLWGALTILILCALGLPRVRLTVVVTDHAACSVSWRHGDGVKANSNSTGVSLPRAR